ncbi:MAG: hypothetical protein WC795_01010 [Candidatus Paceibacterota bacterium]|jgi:hypothetical protein
METIQLKSIQKIKNLVKFLKQRTVKQLAFNKEIEDLTLRLKAEKQGVILFSIQLEETIVFLNEQLRDNFYKSIDYPGTGLFLREIKIIHHEYFDELKLKYWNNIIILFEFDKEHFNNSISLRNLGFNDEKKRISEQVVGLGFDPEFADEEKYLAVRDALREVREKIKESQK